MSIAILVVLVYLKCVGYCHVQYDFRRKANSTNIMTGATSGSGTAYPFGAPEFTPVFSGVRVAGL